MAGFGQLRVSGVRSELAARRLSTRPFVGSVKVREVRGFTYFKKPAALPL